MEDLKNTEEKKPYRSSFKIFGEPIIQSQCQRDGFMVGICGGTICGLIAFLFTSNPRGSTYVGVGSYAVIGFSYAACCLYDEYKKRVQIRILKQALYNVAKAKNDENNDIINSSTKLENI